MKPHQQTVNSRIIQLAIALSSFAMLAPAHALTPYQQQQQQEQARQRQQEQRRQQLDNLRRQQQRETLRQQQQLRQNQEAGRVRHVEQERQLEIQRQQLVTDQNRQIELRKVALREQEARERERLAALKRRDELARLKKSWSCANSKTDPTNMPSKTITRAQAQNGYIGRSGGAGRVEVRYRGTLITVPSGCLVNTSSRSAQPSASASTPAGR